MSASVVTCNFSYPSGSTIAAKLFEVDNIDAGEVKIAAEVVEYLDGQGRPTGRYYATFQEVAANDYQMIIYASNVGVKSDMFYTITDDSTHVYPWSEWKPATGNGIGSFTVSLTIKTSLGVVVSGCDVVVTASNSSSTTSVVASGRSISSGVVTFQLDAGTYYLWLQKDGYNFTNPVTIVVDSNGDVT